MKADVLPHTDVLIEGCRVGAFRIPTDAPESDGTLEWNATTLVVVELNAGGETGLGYTYANTGVAETIRGDLTETIVGADPFHGAGLWAAMFSRLRNLGRQGASAMAVSAVDVAIWDLRAKCLGVPLVKLLGQERSTTPVYGSGGFTSYSDAQLQSQFEGWSELGITRFKMKIGRDFVADMHRVRRARAAIGDRAELFVDANSAYSRKQAREMGERLVHDFNVRWFEEPLEPDDLAGLKALREQLPATLELAEGEYGYDLDYFRRLLQADAVDVAMADVTRCGGVTGFLKIAALCEAWSQPLSTHCAPAQHVHLACAVEPLRHIEYFHDHVRIEQALFDGVPKVREGLLEPELGVPGHCLTFKWRDAERYEIG